MAKCECKMKGMAEKESGDSGGWKAKSFPVETKLFENASELSVVGLRHCFNSNKSHKRRIFWIVLVCFGLLVATFFVYSHLIHFFSFPVTTQVDFVSASSIQFPSITICSGNYIKKHAADELGLTEYFKQFMQPYRDFPPSKILGPLPNFTQEELSQARDFLSPGIEQLIYCALGEELCPHSIQSSLYTNLGRCINLNPRLEEGLSISRPGSQTALHLLFNGNLSDFFVQEAASAGFFLYLHHPLEPPRMMEFGTKLSLGEVVDVVFSIVNLTRPKRPYGVCVDKEDYHPVACERQHEKKELLKECACKLFYMPGDEPNCDYYEERTCAKKTLNKYYKEKQNSDLCPPLCHQIFYNSQVTTSKFSKHYIVNKLAQLNMEESFAYFSENYVYLSIFVRCLEYTKMTIGSAYSFTDLMSDVGGSLSLMLGATLFTLVEVTEFLSTLFSYFVIRRRAKTVFAGKT